MSVTIQSPIKPDVTRRNPRGAIYLDSTGIPVTPNSAADLPDGSIRIVLSTDGQGGKPQLKTNGVWNSTTWEVAQASLLLGLDLRLSAAGDWLRTNDINLDIDALIPHIQFTTAGTSPYAQTPILAALITNQVIQSDFSVDTVATVHGSTNQVPIEILGVAHRHKTGTTAATSQVQISHYHGTDNTGILFWTMAFPASTFPASSDVVIQLDGLAEAFPFTDIYTEFVSATAFSMLGNSSAAPYTSWDFYPVSEEDLMSSTTGMDRVLTSFVDTHIIIDQTGNLILSGESPG